MIRPEVQQLSKYHREILEDISGENRAMFLVETDEGYFLKLFTGMNKDGSEHFYKRKIRASTITKLLKMECINYADANDPDNGIIRSTFSKYDFE